MHTALIGAAKDSASRCIIGVNFGQNIKIAALQFNPKNFNLKCFNLTHHYMMIGVSELFILYD